MSISELARRAESPTGLISQVERELADAGLVTVRKLARALDIPLFNLFEETESEDIAAVRREGRMQVRSPGGIAYSRISAGRGRLEVLGGTLSPGSASAAEPWTRPSEECFRHGREADRGGGRDRVFTPRRRQLLLRLPAAAPLRQLSPEGDQVHHLRDATGLLNDGACVRDPTVAHRLMRLFVALTPPPDVVAELRIATEALRAEQPGLRWVLPDQLHLTLAFLGEVGEGTASDLAERLGRVAGRHPPLLLSLGGAGRFGNRVLWTRVRGESDRLRRLAASVQAAGRRARLPVEARPYRPHLTLARARDGADLLPALAALGGFEGRAWAVDELHLVCSHLGAGPGGTARHELRASWPLQGR
jgi:2'-5' RNA ligase